MNKDKLDAFLADYKKIIEKYGLCFEAQWFYDNPYMKIIKITDLGCSIEEEIEFICNPTLESYQKR